MEAPDLQYADPSAETTTDPIVQRLTAAIGFLRHIERYRIRWIIQGAPNNQAAHDLAAAGRITLTPGHNGIDHVYNIHMKGR